jgi:hypothetical protein
MLIENNIAINMFSNESILETERGDNINKDINNIHFVDGRMMQRVMRNDMDKKAHRIEWNDPATKWLEDLLNEFPENKLKEEQINNVDKYVQNDWSILSNKKNKYNLKNDEIDDDWYNYNPFEKEGWEKEMLIWYGDEM